MNNENICRKLFFKQIYKTITKNISVSDKDNGQYPLRPPGAVEEPLFIKRCNACGDCVKACSYDSIKWLYDHKTKLKKFPVIIPEEQPCYLCDDPVCSRVCPEGALKPITKGKIKLGMAKVIKNRCLALNNIDKNCNYCYDRCPLKGKAIYYNKGPKIDKNHCAGCGMCEYYCVTHPKSIITVGSPRR